VQYEVGEEGQDQRRALYEPERRIDEIDPTRGKLKISVSFSAGFTPSELETAVQSHH